MMFAHSVTFLRSLQCVDKHSTSFDLEYSANVMYLFLLFLLHKAITIINVSRVAYKSRSNVLSSCRSKMFWQTELYILYEYQF
jgi:hypothetical protein